jgi:hypothetical protein
MRTFHAVGAAATGIVIMLSAGCAKADGAPAAPEPYRYDDDAVVLRVQHIGGFVMPSTLVSRLPIVTIYGDGRLITEGPQIAIYPAPALPNIQVQRIDPANLDVLVSLALDAGVGGRPDLGQPGVADLPSTRFTVLAGNGPQTLDVYALTEDMQLPGLSEQQRAARKKLLDLQAALVDPAGVLGKGSVTEVGEYQPTTLAAISTPYVDGGGEVPAPAVKAWPGPRLPGASFSQGLDLGCVTVTGEALTKTLAAARTANSITPWSSGGKRWTLVFRPLLPDERDCSSLQLLS